MYGVAHDTYSSNYPQFGVTTDARITVFAKCANVVASTNFGVHFMIENMLNDDWWKKTEPWARQLHMNPNYDRANDLREYDVFLKVSLLILHLRAIESSFRDYVRVKWPKESADGTGNFSGVYGMLIRNLQLESQHEELLELYNTSRNLIHNNGVYYPSGKKLNQSNPLIYKGTTYPFEPKQIVEFTEWKFVLMLVRDSLDLLLAVVNHSEITSPAEIRDSFGNPTQE